MKTIFTTTKQKTKLKQLTRIILLAAVMLFGGLTAKAEDYVLAYVNGNTTYYLARNGTTGVQRVTIFDPSTCIWSCASNTAGTTAGTLNNSNTYGYLFQTVNGTRYFLGAPDADFALATSVVDNYYRWRTNGTYVYNRYSGTYSYYINLANGVARNTTANTASNARPYQVTTTTVESTSTNPTISGADVLTATGTSSYSASGATYQTGYTNYSFNNADHYGITPTPANVSYSWALSSSYASVNNSGVVTVSSLPANDVTMTLTVTATFSGGTPAVAAGTTLSATKEILLQGTTVAAPTITRSGNSVTLATVTSGATIYYTTDGTTPTSSSTVYSGPIDIAGLTFPVTVKAIAIRNGNNSDPASATFNLPACETPVIMVSNTGVVTITCATEGATIHYTSGDNPADPTGSSPAFTSLTLSQGQIVKAIATKTNYENSTMATAEYVVTGVSDGMVVLDDREDHNWNYYQPHGGIDASYGYPDELCSPYPRNVKITYYGYGNNTLSTTIAAAPAANTFNTNTTSSDVKVGIGEDGHTFVYYKTLERDANGLYPYRMIFNPFYVRPKSGNTYTGFYKWRVKSVSGGSISNAGGTTIATTSTTSSNNVWLDADETYYFNPSDNGETNVNNVTSMTVEFEALWAAAEVITSGSFSNDYNSVERNFYVRRSNAASNVFSSTTPCTYSSFYPNGTTNGTTAATMNNRVSVQSGTAQADSKVEYHIWSNTTALNTGGFKVDIGRGMTASGNGPSLTPLSGTHNADKNARLRIETGAYNGGTCNLYGTPSVGNYLVHLDLIFGSDYDRANGDNTQLTFANNQTIQHGAHAATGARWLSFQHLDIWVKSGRMQPGYFTDASATYNRTFYCRSTLENNNYPGISYLTVEGGEFASINGGRGNKTDGVALEDDIVFSLRIKGGTIHGSIYGAASANPSFGGRRVVMTGGMVEGWIAGGCDGTSSGGGATLGNAYFYIGGNAKVGNTANPNRELDGTMGGNVFGAGRGMSTHGVSANPASMKNAYIAIADNGFVLRSIYGGGDYGYTGVISHDGQTSPETAANFFILGGTVNESVFGGGNNNNSACTNANINMTGGLVKGGIYGGSNNSGTMTYNVNIKVDGGQVGTDANNTANIHGGGFGQNTIISGNVDLTLGTQNQTEPGVTVYGDVYGGSALGSVNGTSANTTYHTNVTLNKGIINGSLYGGALGNASIAANVYGPVMVKVNGGSVRKTDSNGANGSGGVYGANNINGAPQRSVEVDIFGTDPAATAGDYALFAVYGGGNAADYTYGNGYPKVTVSNCDNSIEYVYGGGNAAAVASTDVTIYGGNTIGNVFGGGNGISGVAADVDGNTNVLIAGGTIEKVFGGSNSKGTIGGTINVKIEKDASGNCPIHIGEVYGGGNMAPSNAGNITIKCTGEAGETIDYVYGGANEANITGDILLNITGGRINNVFGGNNTSGTISGTITVNVDWSNSSCTANYLGNVYGGGNLAAYTAPNGNKNYPQVNILCGTVSGSVFGGGNGDPNDSTQEKGSIDGNPQVTIGNANTSLHSTVIGNVYGGGNAAKVKGNTFVMTKNRAQLFGNIYGGGNMAPVTGDTKVIINGTINQ